MRQYMPTNLSHVVANFEDGSLPVFLMVIAAGSWNDGRPSSCQSRRTR